MNQKRAAHIIAMSREGRDDLSAGLVEEAYRVLGISAGQVVDATIENPLGYSRVPSPDIPPPEERKTAEVFPRFAGDSARRRREPVDPPGPATVIKPK